VRKFKISVTSFDIVGGIHFYGSVYLDGVKVHECERPDRESAPKWWTDEDEREQGWKTIKFWNALDIVWAAKKWFESAETVQPGDRLVVWSGYFNRSQIREIKGGRGK
jgi:hypothetical protein